MLYLLDGEFYDYNNLIAELEDRGLSIDAALAFAEKTYKVEHRNKYSKVE